MLRGLLALIVFGGAGLLLLVQIPERTGTKDSIVSAPEPPKGFCERPKPHYTVVPGQAAIKPWPVEKVLAEAVAIEKQWTEFGAGPRIHPKAVRGERASEIVRQLQELHGHPRCEDAEKLLPIMRTIDRVAWAEENAVREAKRVADDAPGRKAYADNIERKWLKDGRDATVTASGDRNTTLTFKYILVNRPFVYKLQTETDFAQTAKERGFKKIVLTDGFRDTWTIDLTK